MRKEYLDLVREYLRQRKDYKKYPEEIRNNLYSAGATEDEVQFVLNEKERMSLGILKRIITIELILQGVLILVGVVGIYFYYNWIYKTVSVKKAEIEKIQIFEVKKAREEESLIPSIYSTSNTIDVQKTFSFSASEITLSIPSTGPKKEIFGYLPYWTLGNLDKIDTDIVTTIALFGIEMDGNGNIVTSSNGASEGGWIMWIDPKTTTAIKQLKNKNKKVVITLKSFNNKNIEKLVLSDSAQKTFISNAIQMVNSKQLDGINIDFEYIGTPNPKVRENFTRFITNLYIQLKKQVPNAQLTIATYVHSASALRLFDVTALSTQSDALVIMGYDFHTPSGAPGPVAPMEGELSLLGFMSTYLEKVRPEKLILALPHYGYDWPLTSGVDKPKSVSFAEASELSKTHAASWNSMSQTPYYQYTSSSGIGHIVHFENARSLGIKYDYINKKNFKGVGIWALGYDGLNRELSGTIIEKFYK